MGKNNNWRRRSKFSLVLVVIALTSNSCFAAKGGNGNGNGGGNNPPVVPPVSYSVTSVALPGSTFYFNDHNNSTAVVGWDSEASQAVAYLPSHDSNRAIYLDEIAPVGVAGWHMRSAMGVNNQGVIVGNLEPIGWDDTNGVVARPFVITGAGSSAPVLEPLGPFSPSSSRESALRINDSGDIVGLSRQDVDGVLVDSIYVGNPSLEVPFQKVDYPANWELWGGGKVRLSNRIGTHAILSGIVENTDDGHRQPFRMELDANFNSVDFELSPTYVDAAGSHHEWWLANDPDLNDSGDVAGGVFVDPSKGRNNLYGGVWNAGAQEYVAAGDETALKSDFSLANHNNDGDLLLATNYYDTLWQGEWSEANGPLTIVDVIDDDPNRHFITSFDLTDRNSNDWPSIIGYGTETLGGVEKPLILILDPILNATKTTVPEPTGAVLTLMALLATTMFRRSLS